MALSHVSMENVRCIERAELDLDLRSTLLWGENGSGKTSLLEGFFLLGRGRSFRTRSTERVIRHGMEQLLVFGRTVGPERTLGVQASRGNPTIGRIDGAPVGTLTELSGALPVQVIDPSVHRLIEEAAPARRRWMDWAVFHVEPRFLDSWTRYTRALHQRNAALRLEPAQASAWDAELARSGEALSHVRRRSIEQIEPFWAEVVRALLGRDATLTYSQGWAKDRSLGEALLDSSHRDRARGLTHVGPHRADVLVRIEGALARDVASRGQQKLLAAAMILAQMRLVRSRLETTPTLLLDDPAAELDASHLEAFIEEVGKLACQIVLTSLVPGGSPFGEPGRRFHVEHGTVRPV